MLCRQQHLFGGDARTSHAPSSQWSMRAITFCFDPQGCPDQGKQGSIEHDCPIAVQRHVHGHQALEGKGGSISDKDRQLLKAPHNPCGREAGRSLETWVGAVGSGRGTYVVTRVFPKLFQGETRLWGKNSCASTFLTSLVPQWVPSCSVLGLTDTAMLSSSSKNSHLPVRQNYSTPKKGNRRWLCGDRVPCLCI